MKLITCSKIDLSGSREVMIKPDLPHLAQPDRILDFTVLYDGCMA